MSSAHAGGLPAITLVLGGARSGKSRHAEALTASRVGAGQRPVYLATAEPGDDEMRRRIEAHRARRGTGWTTREEPLAVADALVIESRPGRPILVDCLTLWLSNVLHAARDADADAALLAHAVARVPGPVEDPKPGDLPDAAARRPKSSPPRGPTRSSAGGWCR